MLLENDVKYSHDITSNQGTCVKMFHHKTPLRFLPRHTLHGKSWKVHNPILEGKSSVVLAKTLFLQNNSTDSVTSICRSIYFNAEFDAYL